MGPDLIRLVTPADRTPGPPTPGMDRQQAWADDDMWSGFVRTEVGMISGWHHHGEYESVIYVLTGALGWSSVRVVPTCFEAGPGDFMCMPKSVVHRESNPSTEVGRVIVVRAGRGESTFNVDGP